MNRITDRNLEALVETINKVTNSPKHAYVCVKGRNIAQIGHYHLSYAYGGVQLHQMANESGGVHDVLRCGYTTKRDLWNRMQAFLSGLTTQTQAVSNV